jgi:polyphenol oxidase
MSTMTNRSRRTFLKHMAGGGAAAGVLGWGRLPAFAAEPQHCAGPTPPATPIKWTPDTNPILPRLAASTLGPADVTKLRSAYEALRSLTTSAPNDPRGWLQQGDKHCWNCGGGLDGQAGEEIHGSWLFLPWHRAYLYFHERILGTLINDKSLRLAYWDWDNSQHRGVPPAWLTPNSASNSLFDANRSAVAGNEAPNSIVGPLIMSPIINASTFARFGGRSPSPTANRAGNLENGPHGAVHIWSGDTSMQAANPDMGLLDTAAQDPLFFAHHSNIDRLWNVWLGAASTHKNPTDTSWLTHKFTFWDERKRWVSITPADVINMSAKLRYTYGPAAAHPLLVMATPKVLKLNFDPSKAIVIPDAVRKRVTAAPTGMAPAAKLTVLRLEGIELPPSASGIYRIIANKPGATAAEVADTPNDLGYIAIVPKTSKDRGGHHGTLDHDLNVTESLGQLAGESGKLNISYAALGQTGDAAKGNPLTYQNVYLIEH